MNNTHHWVTWSFGAPGPNAFPFRSLCVSIQVSSHRCCPVTASPEHLFTMSASSKQSLSAQWKSAQHGRLCAWEMAKALGLREASKELHGGKPNMTWIAARVTKHGGGNPTQQAMTEFFGKVDADPDWYPGKHSGEKRGVKPLFNSAKRRCVALNAMTSKENKDQEPCVAAAVLACPKATWNPKTKKPFCDKTIRKVYTTQCYVSVSKEPMVVECACLR